LRLSSLSRFASAATRRATAAHIDDVVNAGILRVRVARAQHLRVGDQISLSAVQLNIGA